MARACLLAFALLFSGIFSAAADVDVNSIPWKERTWEQKYYQSSYADEFTYKNNKPYYKDPFIWALSPEFTERFGMPKQWIDPELKGALAVAWRITNIGPTLCGYNGNPDLCWPPLTCQMDIYVDSQAPIPWQFNDVEREFLWQGLSSLDYIPKRFPTPRRARYQYAADQRNGSKGTPFFHSGWQYKSGVKDAGFDISYFDRAYTQDITLIGFTAACPSLIGNGAAALRFITADEQHRTQGRVTNFIHSVEFSSAFMEKITSIYRPAWEESKKTNRAYQWIMQGHFSVSK